MKNLLFFLFLTSFAVGGCIAQSEGKLDAKVLKVLELSTPAALPQEPIVPKERTDAEDEGLKGKVKSITGESQDLSGTGDFDGRHRSYIDDYDTSGMLVREVSFDSRGNPSDITIYGYLNNLRVSKIGSIRNDYDPPPPMPSPTSSGKAEQNTPDLRINYSYRYKYLNGTRTEMQMYYNDGRPGMRYTYTLNGDTLEKLAFDDQGKLNQKYVYKLDKRGNQIEDFRIDLTSERYFGDKRFVYTYDSFDKMRNWTRRTATRILVANGKEIIKPAFIHFRTITYFN